MPTRADQRRRPLAAEGLQCQMPWPFLVTSALPEMVMPPAPMKRGPTRQPSRQLAGTLAGRWAGSNQCPINRLCKKRHLPAKSFGVLDEVLSHYEVRPAQELKAHGSIFRMT